MPYDIIESATCAEIRLMEDEVAERVTDILDREIAAED